jgi:hypothetical protein
MFEFYLLEMFSQACSIGRTEAAHPKVNMWHFCDRRHILSHSMHYKPQMRVDGTANQI